MISLVTGLLAVIAHTLLCHPGLHAGEPGGVNRRQRKGTVPDSVQILFSSRRVFACSLLYFTVTVPLGAVPTPSKPATGSAKLRVCAALLQRIW